MSLAWALLAAPLPADAHDSIETRLARASQLLAARPDDPAAWLGRGELHRHHRAWDAARFDFSRAEALLLRLGPAAPDRAELELTLWLARATLELETDRPERASPDLERYLMARPRDGFARYLWGRSIAERPDACPGDVQRAIEEIDHALALLDPPQPEQYVARARLCATAGRAGFERALVGLDRARERLGRLPVLEAYAAQLEVALGQRERAHARLDSLRPQFAHAPAWARLAAEVLGDATPAPGSDAHALSNGRRPETCGAVSHGTRAESRRGDRDERRGERRDERQSERQSEQRGEGQRTHASTADTIHVTRGPYLQRLTPVAVRMRWRTDVPTDARVVYGSSPAALTSTAVSPSVVNDHQVQIQGLAAGTRYFYAIGNGVEILAGGDSSHSFVTHPTPGTAVPTRVWLLGDSGAAGDGARRVRNAYREYTGSTPTDVWILLGDNAYDSGTDLEYQAALFEMYPTFLRSLSVWPTRGNHDMLHSGPNNDYYDIFSLPFLGESGGLPSGSEAYYAFDYGNIHFVCLDSEGSDRTPAGPMLTWLQQDLAATTQDWKIAYWHHPPYTRGNHDSDDPEDSGGRMIDMRENALPLLEQGGVDLVFCGHSHSYERSYLLDEHYGSAASLVASMILDSGDGDPAGDGAYEKPAGTLPHEGTVYTVAGSSSKTSWGPLDHPAMVRAIEVHGSVVLDVDGLTLDAVFLDSTAAVRDHFRVVKGVAAAVGPTTPPLPLLETVEPNPFASATTIRFALPRAADVRLTVSDIEGRHVRSLLSGRHDGGAQAITWDGRDDRGRAVASGAYFIRASLDGRLETRRVVLLR